MLQLPKISGPSIIQPEIFNYRLQMERKVIRLKLQKFCALNNAHKKNV